MREDDGSRRLPWQLALGGADLWVCTNAGRLWTEIGLKLHWCTPKHIVSSHVEYTHVGRESFIARGEAARNNLERSRNKLLQSPEGVGGRRGEAVCARRDDEI